MCSCDTAGCVPSTTITISGVPRFNPAKNCWIESCCISGSFSSLLKWEAPGRQNKSNNFHMVLWHIVPEATRSCLQLCTHTVLLRSSFGVKSAPATGPQSPEANAQSQILDQGCPTCGCELIQSVREAIWQNGLISFFY